jgi:colicin import membrane protein
LVRNVANYIGLKIKYATLFLCAVLAFVALFVAMEMSTNPDSFFFVRLGAMTLVSAALLTALNWYLVFREEDIEADFTEEVRRAYSKNADKKTSTEILPSLKLKPKEEPKLETLEELVNYAKSENAIGNVTSAVDAYQKVLEDYPDDDETPFVAIELGAIYREQAAYLKAIKVYEEALNLAAVKKNSAVKEEFLEKLNYIKAVQSVLLRHHALSTPFSQIPEKYLQEVELELSGKA